LDCNKSQTFRNTLKYVRLKIDAVKPYSFRKPILGVYFITGEIFSRNIFGIKMGAGKICFWEAGHIHALCNRKQWLGPAQFCQFLQLGLRKVATSKNLSESLWQQSGEQSLTRGLGTAMSLVVAR